MKNDSGNIKFDNEQVKKYSSAEISGTGYLAFRDIEKFTLLHGVDTSKVLDLGCGAGRSTEFLSKFCSNVSGIDISKEMLTKATNIHANHKFYFNNDIDEMYPYSPYTAIFSILMFFHLSSEENIRYELMKCYRSLINFGHLIIVNGTSHLYSKNYTSVRGIGDPPVNDGDTCNIELKNINCKLKDYYWSDKSLIHNAEKCGLTCLGSHFPLGKNEDVQSYIDEYHYAPYYYLAFKKI